MIFEYSISVSIFSAHESVTLKLDLDPGDDDVVCSAVESDHETPMNPTVITTAAENLMVNSETE